MLDQSPCDGAPSSLLTARSWKSIVPAVASVAVSVAVAWFLRLQSRDLTVDDKNSFLEVQPAHSHILSATIEEASTDASSPFVSAHSMQDPREAPILHPPWFDVDHHRVVHSISSDIVNCKRWLQLAGNENVSRPVQIFNTEESKGKERHFGIGIDNMNKMEAASHYVSKADLDNFRHVVKEIKRHLREKFSELGKSRLKCFAQKMVCRERPAKRSAALETARPLLKRFDLQFVNSDSFGDYLSHDIHEDTGGKAGATFWNTAVFLQDIAPASGGEFFFTDFGWDKAEAIGYHNISGVVESRCGHAVSYRNQGNFHGVRGLMRGMRRCALIVWLEEVKDS